VAREGQSPILPRSTINNINIMKNLLTRFIPFCALLLTLAVPARAEESKRGFYEGDLAGGGKIVFFVQGNRALSTYIFDVAAQQADFGGGAIATSGTFSLTTNGNRILSGTVTKTAVTATLNATHVTATRVGIFGSSDDLGGRFTATAHSTGATLEVKFLIDSQGRIFFIGKNGASVIGGFGAVSILHASHGADDPPGHDAGDDHGQDPDEFEDHHEDQDDHEVRANFTLTLVTGQAVTGHIFHHHDLLVGDFTLNGVTFTFRAPQESSANHLANISTRGFVNTGQGQLISGFIIRGGPKLVIIRALGPSLASRGVSPVLADPTLKLFSGATLLAQNDNWQSAVNVDETRGTAITPTNARESALVIRLEPGAYTTVVTGADNGTGIALVEVYELDLD
jgi:hypothetical protein